jgi:hypothetical protein
MNEYQYSTAVHCPFCDRVMKLNRDMFTVECVGKRCKIFGQLYHAPSVELVPYDQAVTAAEVEYTITQDTGATQWLTDD